MYCSHHIEDNPSFGNAFTKCRKIVGYFKHSPANTMELSRLQVALRQVAEPLVQDVSKRWNLSLAMITHLQQNWEAVKATLDQQNVGDAETADNVTELLGGDDLVSCSVVLPALCHLNHTTEISDDDPNYVVRFKTIKGDLATRVAETNITWLKLASVLDPRFKDIKCLPRGERVEVWTRLEEMLQEAAPRRWIA
ncbi:hypothetical protein N1851_031178 [Merluccius polli]|uniref:Uncharacterized protein n=1 Tax=Merluccius polli TaxID=89951 RepID=A0AA47M459_MERPO|nr:hypothetical protein N1851_031178 [Merluccius polli]